jgi:hypothetical protein
MKNDLIDLFIIKSDSYLHTANSDSITYHSKAVDELLDIAKKIHSDIISLYYDSNLSDNQKLVIVHILDRLEYNWKSTRKGIPYSIEFLKEIYLNALNSKNEALRFQAIKCSSIAQAITKEQESFGDFFFDKLYQFLSDSSSRIRKNTLFLLCCNAPDYKPRNLKSINPLKKVILDGEYEEYFQALQYLKGKKEIFDQIKPELRMKISNYDGTYELFYPEVFVRYLDKNEILNFVNRAIKLNSAYSLKSVIILLGLKVYPEIKEACANRLTLWYNNFPELRSLIVETCTNLEIHLDSLNGDKISNLPENEFLLIVSNKKVEGTLQRIIKLFSSNAILISRGDGGFDILSAISFYKEDEIMEFIGLVPDNILEDILSYCKKD